VRGLDHRGHLVGEQLRGRDALVLAGDPARDHHLDQVGAGLDLAAHAVAEADRPVALHRVAALVAVPAGADQRAAGRVHARADRPAGVDGPAQREVGVVLLGHVAHGGDAAVEGAAGAVGHVEREVVRAHVLDAVAAASGQRQRKMGVHVGQAGRHERAVHVALDDRSGFAGPRGDSGVRAHGCDAVTGDPHAGVLDRLCPGVHHGAIAEKLIHAITPYTFRAASDETYPS
jgi:hypothetical protein